MEKKDKKQLIIETAEELFGRYGFKRVTVDEIVKKSGIAKGTFYLYFLSKDSLYLEIALMYKAEGEKNLKTIVKEEKDVKIRFLRAFLSRLKYIDSHPIAKELFLDNDEYYSPSVNKQMVFQASNYLTGIILKDLNMSLKKGVDIEMIGKVHWFFTTIIKYKDVGCVPNEEFWQKAKLMAQILIDGIFSEYEWKDVGFDYLWRHLEEQKTH